MIIKEMFHIPMKLKPELEADCNDITEILLKVALNTITITP
jgi:hypothetical protein